MKGDIIHQRSEGANENGRKLIELCTEKRLSVGNTFFEKNDIHKFAWVSGVDDHKTLPELFLMQEKERNKLLYVNVLTGAGGGIAAII